MQAYAIHADDAGRPVETVRPFARNITLDPGETWADAMRAILATLDCTFPVSIVDDAGTVLASDPRY